MKQLRRFINNADIRRFRSWIQLASFVVLIYGGYAAINISDRLPTFACGFVQEGKGGTCYLLPLQHQMHIPWESIISWRGLGILTGLLTFLAWLVVLNKAWCGYICPLGTLQDWMTKLRQRLGIRFSSYSADTFRRLKEVKYILLLLLLIIPFGMANSLFGLPKIPADMATPFCQICPGRTLLPLFTGDFSQLTVDFSTKTAMVMTALGMLVTGLFLVGAFVNKRFFCFFCPMSALHFIFSKFAFLKLKKDGSKCTRCGDCYRVCDMQIKEIADDVITRDIMRDDCMLCLKCVAACPEDKCLEVKFLGIPVYQSTEEGFFNRTQQGAKGEH